MPKLMLFKVDLTYLLDVGLNLNDLNDACAAWFVSVCSRSFCSSLILMTNNHSHHFNHPLFI